MSTESNMGLHSGDVFIASGTSYDCGVILETFESELNHFNYKIFTVRCAYLKRPFLFQTEVFDEKQKKLKLATMENFEVVLAQNQERLDNAMNELLALTKNISKKFKNKGSLFKGYENTCGIVMDILTSSTGEKFVKTFSVRNAYKCQRYELQPEYVMSIFKHATMKDFQASIDIYQSELDKELKRLMRMVKKGHFAKS